MRYSTIVLHLVLAGAAFAQAPPAPSGSSAELLANETRRRVTEEVKRFLEERCPQQCDVGEVTVKIARRKAPVGATPGFEELSPDVKDFVVDRADVTVMLDRRLTNDFRSGLRTILAKKLQAEGISNVIHESIIHFPTPQDLPEKPQPPQMVQMIPAAQPAREPERAAAGPVSYLPVPERSAWARFVEALPLLLGLLLCAAVVWFTLRQYQRLLEPRAAEAAAAPDKETPETAEQAKELAARRELERAVEALKGRLGDPAIAREVMRDLLLHGSAQDAALTVLMLGPSILDGVRNDLDCRAGLDTLDGYLSERMPPDSSHDRKRLLADLERRLLRVQVARGTRDNDNPFAYLRDAHVALFARLLGQEEAEVQALVLRHAPSHMVHAYIERQPPAAREKLVEPLLEHATYDRAHVGEVAARFRDRLSRHTFADQHDPIGDLLQAAEPEERRRLLSGLRGNPEGLRSALASFVSEETLHALDGEVLAAAMMTLDPRTTALFVSSLDEVARKRLLGALPAVTAQAVAEEAGAVASSPVQRLEARRAALLAVRRAIEDRGLDLADVNRRILAKELAS